jgi:hypothetical protein
MLTTAWDLWKKGFDAWEDATARYAEQVLRSPAVLTPAGSMFTAMMKTKAATDRLTDAWWSACGLPTRRDQERSLHALNQIQSRLADLEEQLAELRAPRP